MTITIDNLEYYAWTSAVQIKGNIRAVLLDFQGLGFNEMKVYPNHFDLEMAANGVLVITPFYNPWCWMNKETVVLLDEIIEAVYKKHSLTDTVPLLSTGGSMGGLCALIYCVYGRKAPVACYANCPVCDLPYHATERQDLPRTMYSAFSHYDGGVEQGLLLASPLHQAERFPRIPYFIIHADNDPAVRQSRHSEPFVKKMRTLGHNVEYMVTRNDWHCAFNDIEQYKKKTEFLLRYRI